MSSTYTSPGERVRPRFEDEADRLCDRHEVARRVGLRDRERQAIVELALQERHDAAARAQDVAEPDGGIRVARAVASRDRQLLGETLRRAHDADGLDRLVRRDEDEPPDVEVLAGPQDVACPDHVGQHALGRIELDVRDVLEGGGVEDDVGPRSAEDGVQGGGRADVGERRDDMGAVRLAAKGRDVALDVPQRPLVLVHDRQDARAEREDLADELAADRATTAGHHDRGAVDGARHRLEVDLDRRSTQEVLDVHGADAGHLVMAGHHVAQRWDDLDAHP